MTNPEQSKFRKFSHNFNSIYDLLARIIKTILFIFIAVIIFWKLPYIDWDSTSKAVVEENTPLKFEKPVAEQSVIKDEKKDYLNIYQYGQIVFSVDKPYEITSSDNIVFDKLLLKGRPNYDELFLYAGVEIKIMKINESIGMLVSGGAVQGPLLRGVYCKIIRRYFFHLTSQSSGQQDLWPCRALFRLQAAIVV